MAFNDGIKVGPIAYIGLVSVLVTFVLVLLLQVVYYQQDKQTREAYLSEAGPPEELTELTAKQQTALMKRGEVGIVRAKELVITDLAAGKLPSEVIGPKRSAAAPAKAPAQEAAELGGEQPAAEAAAAETTSEANEEPQKKQERKDDKS